MNTQFNSQTSLIIARQFNKLAIKSRGEIVKATEEEENAQDLIGASEARNKRQLIIDRLNKADDDCTESVIEATSTVEDAEAGLLIVQSGQLPKMAVATPITKLCCDLISAAPAKADIERLTERLEDFIETMGGALARTTKMRDEAKLSLVEAQTLFEYLRAKSEIRQQGIGDPDHDPAVLEFKREYHDATNARKLQRPALPHFKSSRGNRI